MANVSHVRHITDTRTSLAVTLKQPNAAGVDTAVDLSGLTVEFKMVDGDGVDVIAQTATGVTVSDAANGLVEYEFPSAGVDTKGVYFGYFVVTESGKTDHFPVSAKELVICVDDDV